MKIRDFKTHTISRSSPPHQDRYSDYKPYLRADFCKRCAYCNLLDESITTPFEVDHFIPRATFKDCRMDLDTDYTNLIYSCKKCNNAKRKQFSGDITVEKPTNELFYDPVKVDYNTIFFRNQLGSIDSVDDKGKDTIVRLKLYRPIHNLSWICEEMYSTAEKLEASIQNEPAGARRDSMVAALNRINSQYRKLSRLFTAAYNDNSFAMSDIENVD